MTEAIYRQQSERYHPTDWAGSPWSTEHQHGGAVNALVARGALSAARALGMRPVRLHVDLLGMVPMRPLALETEILRESGRSAQVDVLLRDGHVLVARGSVLLFRPAPEVASGWSRELPPPPGPEGLSSVPLMPREFRETMPPGFHWSLEVRMAEDGAVAWITTPLDLVDGERMHDFERAAAVADLSFGLGGRAMHRLGEIDIGGAPPPLLINADTSLHLTRLPVGAWTGMRSSSVRDHEGIGIAEAELWDESGRFARSLQSLIHRPPPTAR